MNKIDKYVIKKYNMNKIEAERYIERVGIILDNPSMNEMEAQVIAIMELKEERNANKPLWLDSSKS